MPLELGVHDPALVGRAAALLEHRVGGVVVQRGQAAVRVHVPDALVLQEEQQEEGWTRQKAS